MGRGFVNAAVLDVALAGVVLELELLVVVDGVEALECAEERRLAGLVLADHRGNFVYVDPAGVVNGFEIGNPSSNKFHNSSMNA